MRRPPAVKKLIWWAGKTTLLVFFGILFAGNMMLNRAALPDLVGQLDIDRPPVDPIVTVVAVFSLLLTVLWATLILGILNKMRKRCGGAALRPGGWLLDFSGLPRSAFALIAFLPLICTLIHGREVLEDRSLREEQRREAAWQKETARNEASVQEAVRWRQSRPASTARPVNLRSLLPAGQDPRDASVRSARFAAYWYVLNNLDSLNPDCTPEIRETGNFSLSPEYRRLTGTIVYKTRFPNSQPLILTWDVSLHWDKTYNVWIIDRSSTESSVVKITGRKNSVAAR